MGKRISTLIQSSFNMKEGHITRETVNKGFQAQMKREKEGVLWGGVVLKALYDDFLEKGQYENLHQRKHREGGQRP